MANSKARLLEREREFVRNAAHELRTPITIARGHSELIQMYHDDAGLQQDIAVVLEELDRLGNLTARMVTLAAAEDPEFLHLEDVDILEVMHDISRRWTSTVPRQWSVRPEAAGAIRADRARLDVALDALIENAIAFTDEQDSVTVSSWRANGSALIAVTDSGKGIAPDALKRIFDRFTTTGRQAARRSTGGTGLGLPIVKAIIEAHGGSVDVSSTLGYGSTFTVRLPSSASPERSGLMPTATMRAAAVGG
jgi:signal transduction histidine kinase